ncbi:MAG: hypothetical protein V7K94_31920, partial [Nostoc sp.]|uniref:hypothetical protein n=1 Tax=Nostoc sp. TaxID=1180 RepID=UPI002FFB9B37
MKGLPTAAPSFPFKMIIIIGDGIVYFLEVPNVISVWANNFEIMLYHFSDFSNKDCYQHRG